MAYWAVLDANVLHPAVLSDLFLRLAEKDFFRPLWSAQIRSEAEGSILRVRPDVDPVRLKYRFDCMDAAFPDATVSGVETLTPVLTAEFGEDAHVVAAAIIGGADAIVTENMKDFPAEPTLKLHRIEAQRADEFLVNQWWLAPKVVCEVVVEMAADRKKARTHTRSDARNHHQDRSRVRHPRPRGPRRLRRKQALRPMMATMALRCGTC